MAKEVSYGDFAKIVSKVTGKNYSEKDVSNAAKKISSGGSGGSSGSGSKTTVDSSIQALATATGKTYAEVEAAAAKVNSGSYTPASTTTTPKNTYNYVDASGNIKQVQASSADEAMKIAPNIGASSGVQLVSKNALGAAVDSSVVRDEIADREAENIPTPPITDETDFNDFEESIGKRPTIESQRDVYAKQREQLGIEALEDTVNMWDEKIAESLANLEKFKRAEYEGQSLGFAQGRISTEQQLVQDQLDFYTRQQNAAINKLNYKNKYIENIMKLTQQDYDNANSAYQFEFNKSLQIQQMVTTEKNQIRDDSRAMLTTIVNNMSKAGIDINSLDPAMLSNISTLELQAGAPLGSTVAFYQADPNANVMYQGVTTDASGKEYYYQVVNDPTTGGTKVNQIPTGGTSKKNEPSNADTNRQMTEDINEVVLRFKEAGEMDKEVYKQYTAWIKDNYGATGVVNFNKALDDNFIDYE
jgi:hypothetical protein